MKILQMYRNLGAGGIEAMIFHLSNEMANYHNVTVCTINHPSENDHFYRGLDPRIKKETIGKTEKTNPLSVVFDIYRYIKKGNFDIVQLHGFFYFFSLAVLLLHKKSLFFYTVHNDAVKENNPWDFRMMPLKKFCFKKKWMRPITISPASKESFTTYYNCDSKLIENGIAKPSITSRHLLSEMSIANQTRVFINPGRISVQKNQEMLCKVFKRLIEEGYNVTLLIVGPLHIKDIYKRLSFYFSENIRFLGERSDVPQLMSECDGMCLSSIYEGLPVVLLEALAVGCVPICTPVGGIINVISNGENGFLSSEVSEESYYKAMKSFLDDSESHINQIKENCKSSFQKYDIKLTAKNYMDYYDSTLHSIHP